MAGRQRCPTVDWETGSIFRNSSAVAGLVTNHSNSHLSLSLQGTGESPLCYSSTLGLSLSYLSVYEGKNPKDHQLSPALAAGTKLAVLAGSRACVRSLQQHSTALCHPADRTAGAACPASYKAPAEEGPREPCPRVQDLVLLERVLLSAESELLVRELGT